MIMASKTNSFLVIIIYLIFPLTLYSKGFTIEGTVYNDNGETLPGVNISLNGGKYGTACNSEGHFRFENLPQGTYSLTASFIGYNNFTKTINLADENITLTIKMEPSHYMLDEVRVEENQRQIVNRAESITIERIQQDFLKNQQAGSLMQTLRQLPGVHSMNVGTGMSKPMIRGLGFYRVLFTNNGIRQAGQHWSSHIGLSIDQHCIEQMEIVKGPSSLRYGSDAIGGVINILPRSIPERGEFSGEVSFTGKSNTFWLGSTAAVSGRRGNFYFHANATHNSFGDYKVPDTDVFLLPAPVGAAHATHEVDLGDYVLNTAGVENAASFTSGLVKPWGNSYLNFSYHSSKNGFFDWMGLRHEENRKMHQENRREINYPYQQIDNYSINHFTNRFFGENKLEIALGYQYNTSGEHCVLTDRTGNRREDIEYYRSLDNLELKLDLHSVNANILYSLRSYENHKFDFILNKGYEKNLIDGYAHIIPEYERISAGAAIVHRYNYTEQWVVNTGLRMDFHNLFMEESLNPDPAFGDSIFNPEYGKTFIGTAGSFGVNYLYDDNMVFKVNIGKSYRMPSVYELGAYGLHRHEGRFERGDLNIKPEEAWQLDVGFEKISDNLEFSLSPFVNYFTNYLFLNPTPELRSEGQVYEYHQNVALLYGGEASVEYTFSDKLRFRTGLEYVYALNVDLMRPLPFTPPFSVTSKLTYFLDDIGVFTGNRICFEAVKTGAQNNTVPNELNTPGYYSLNINLRTDIKVFDNPAKVRFKASNILDNRYYDHVSFYRRLRIPEQGRGFQLFLSIPFSNK